MVSQSIANLFGVNPHEINRSTTDWRDWLISIAMTAHPIVLTDAATSALLAMTAYPIVLTDAATSALLVMTTPPPVLTDAGPSTVLALIADPIVGTLRRPRTTILRAHVSPCKEIFCARTVG